MQQLNPFKIPFSGVNLIEASAGTGKTYNIASLYVRALIEEEAAIDDILVVTYTKAATAELRDRLMKRLRDSIRALEDEPEGSDSFLEELRAVVDQPNEAIQKLKKAIHSFDQAAIYTIHGFCYQVLQEYAFESRVLFDAEMTGDDSAIIQEIIDDYWRKWVAEVTADPFKKPLLKFIIDKGYDPDSLAHMFSGSLGKPYLHVQPEERTLFLDDLNALHTCYNKMQKAWVGQSEEVLDLLTSERMNGRKYSKKSVPQWIQQMHNTLSEDVPSIDLFKKFDKFTQPIINDSLTQKALKAGKQPPQHPFFKSADTYQTLAASFGEYDVIFKRDVFDSLIEAAGRKKEELQQLSYDDVLIKLRDALTDDPSNEILSKRLRKRYPIALVDEFQDTDPVQYQIFKAIYQASSQNTALFMIGDPKQSIYGFRGADIFAYVQARQELPDDRLFSLNYNYRSTPELVEAINTLFSYPSRPFVFEEISFSPVKAGIKESQPLLIEGQRTMPLVIRDLNGEDDLPTTKEAANPKSAADTASSIQRLLQQAAEGNASIEGRPLKAADIAVLVRTHAQADAITDALQQRGIKSVHYSDKSIFKSKEAGILYDVLQAIAEPEEGHIKTALATSFMGYDAQDLLDFENNEEKWVAQMESFLKCQERWQESGVAAALAQLMQEERLQENIVQQKNGERKLTNYIHLSELLQQEERNGRKGMHNLLQWLLHKCSGKDQEQEEEQLRLESDEQLVKIVTMHSSKGLEYPVVFCPFLWHGPQYKENGKPLTYHDPQDASKVYLDLNNKSEPHRAEKRFQQAREELAESMRLMYVAITRAQYQCVLSWAQAGNSEYSPLGYLLLGDETIDALKQKLFPGKSKKIDPERFKKSLQQLQARNPGLLNIGPARTSEQQLLSFADEPAPLTSARVFQRAQPLEGGDAVSSFSSLSRGQHANSPTHYEDYYEALPQEEEPQPSEERFSIFNFPKGPNPGTSIHYIFEEIDFEDPQNWYQIINKQLANQGIATRWTPVVLKMIERCVSKELSPEASGLKLAALQPLHCIPELEFYFTSAQIHLNRLLEIIRPGEINLSTPNGFAEQGFLKGFIDLTFKFNNRYYLLDYKTNHLGNQITDYQSSTLESAMREALYDLQYHLYTVALHRFLAKKIPNYTYETHFGGAIYLFVRGINQSGGEGIYFDRPKPLLINKLNQYLKGGE